MSAVGAQGVDDGDDYVTQKRERREAAERDVADAMLDLLNELRREHESRADRHDALTWALWDLDYAVQEQTWIEATT